MNSLFLITSIILLSLTMTSCSTLNGGITETEWTQALRDKNQPQAHIDISRVIANDVKQNSDGSLEIR
jgi:hypothetical protein